MKILHLFSSKVFAGLERHVEELSYEQSKSHQVVVIGPEDSKINLGLTTQQLIPINGAIHHYFGLNYAMQWQELILM